MRKKLEKPTSNRKFVAQDYSLVQEENTAKKFNGYKTTGSGNKGMTGDVRIASVARIENKSTTKKSYSIKLDLIKKLENNVIGYDEIPFVQVDFIDEEKNLLGQVAVIPMKLMEMLIDVKTEERTAPNS